MGEEARGEGEGRKIVEGGEEGKGEEGGMKKRGRVGGGRSSPPKNIFRKKYFSLSSLHSPYTALFWVSLPFPFGALADRQAGQPHRPRGRGVLMVRVHKRAPSAPLNSLAVPRTLNVRYGVTSQSAQNNLLQCSTKLCSCDS